MKFVSTFIGILSVIAFGYIKQKELFRFFVHRNFSKFKFGTLCILQQETNDLKTFGVHKSSCEASIIFETIANEEAFYKILVLHGGATGLGEAYMDNLWNTASEQDLGNVLYHMHHNKVHSGSSPVFETILSFKHWYKSFKRRYLITKSKEEDIESISHHYDLDNMFYQSFLGQQLSGYSCGFFNEYKDSVQDAQDNKWNIIIHKLASSLPNKVKSLSTKHKVLDIGSGWGYFPSYLNNKTSTKAYGITISKQQYEYSLNAYAEQIKNGEIHFELLDYRDLGEKYPEYFDFAVSIGMVEHVGLKKLAEFFENIYASLTPDSYFVLHYVSRTDVYPKWRETKRSNACSSSNFISEYIFPGGCILHKDWVHEEALIAGFQLLHSESYGMHYMRTLQEWRKNIMRNWSEYKGKHKDNEKLKRMYEYYFAFCEAAFRTQKINLVQQIYYKPKEAETYTSVLSFKNRIRNPNPHNI